MYVCICVCVPVYICVPTYSHRHVYMYTHTKRTLRHTLPIHFTINLIRLWKAMIELTRVKPTKTRAQYLLSRNVCACRVCDPSQGDARTASKYIYRTASIDTWLSSMQNDGGKGSSEICRKNSFCLIYKRVSVDVLLAYKILGDRKGEGVNVCVRERECVCLCVCVCVLLSIYIYVTYISIYIYMYIYEYKYICMCIFLYIHIHTCMSVSISLFLSLTLCSYMLPY